MDYLADTERVRQNLIDAGLDDGTIADFFAAETKQKTALLHKHRKNLLEDFHNLQKEIDCLDYLLLQIKKANEL